jgi:hypothetical protein
VAEGSFENRSTSFSWERVDPTRGRVSKRPLTATSSSALVGPLTPLHIDRLGDLPEHDPDHGHRLAGNEVPVVERGALGMPLGQKLVLARLRPQLRRPRSLTVTGSSGQPVSLER